MWYGQKISSFQMTEDQNEMFLGLLYDFWLWKFDGWQEFKLSLYRSDIVLLRNLSFEGWRHTY